MANGWSLEGFLRADGAPAMVSRPAGWMAYDEGYED